MQDVASPSTTTAAGITTLAAPAGALVLGSLDNDDRDESDRDSLSTTQSSYSTITSSLSAAFGASSQRNPLLAVNLHNNNNTTQPVPAAPTTQQQVGIHYI
jgi:hypothetical protein